MARSNRAQRGGAAAGELMDIRTRQMQTAPDADQRMPKPNQDADRRRTVAKAKAKRKREAQGRKAARRGGGR